MVRLSKTEHFPDFRDTFREISKPRSTASKVEILWPNGKHSACFFLLWCRSAVSKDICHYYKIGEANYTISYYDNDETSK